jgi:hypothetical protein
MNEYSYSSLEKHCYVDNNDVLRPTKFPRRVERSPSVPDSPSP